MCATGGSSVLGGVAGGGVTALCMVVVVVKVGAMNARSARRHRKQKKEKEGRTRLVKLAPTSLCGKKWGR